MVGDSHYYQAVIHGSLPELDAAATTMPPWPQLPGVHAQLIFGRARQQSDPKLGRSALAYERQAAHRDPADPRWANATGVIEETFGTAARANAAYRHALQLNPWSFQALAGLYRVAARDGNRADAIPLRTRLCRLGPNDCPPRSTLPR
jgi:tetratricopeptide (TPR) repeat protein